MTFSKIKFFINFEKEEEWLNDMAQKGFHLIRFTFGKYTFEKGEPGDYIYRIEMLDTSPSNKKNKDYIEFMEENKIEFVDKSGNWVYFRKKANDGPFEIYTDYASRLKYYNMIARVFGALLLFNLIVAIFNLTLGSFNFYVSLFNWFVVIILIPGFLVSFKKSKKLKKEMNFYDN